MLIIPKEKPVVENLNSFYLDVRRLFEHYQGELGSGAVHFKSPTVEAVVFFDKDDILNGFFQNGESGIEGKAVLTQVEEAAADHNFTVSIYELEPEQAYFWSNIPSAEKIYKDLSAEFTDLEGLIRKMISEKLTGYIDVSISGGDEGGALFFSNGEIIGGSYSWGSGDLNRSDEAQKRLLKMTKESGGTFDVNRISTKERFQEKETRETGSKFPLSDSLRMTEQMLSVFERVATADRTLKTNFNTILKRKFLQKAEKFDFLDPFAAELEYSDQKIRLLGDVNTDDLLKGMVEVVGELADELGIRSELIEELSLWSKENEEKLKRLGVSL